MRNFITCGLFTFFPLAHYWMQILLSQSYFSEHLHLFFKALMSNHYGNATNDKEFGIGKGNGP